VKKSIQNHDESIILREKMSKNYFIRFKKDIGLIYFDIGMFHRLF
jgi:hypothetical protein